MRAASSSEEERLLRRLRDGVRVRQCFSPRPPRSGEASHAAAEPEPRGPACQGGAVARGHGSADEDNFQRRVPRDGVGGGLPLGRGEDAQGGALAGDGEGRGRSGGDGGDRCRRGGGRRS